jgi:hypothetical protein
MKFGNKKKFLYGIPAYTGPLYLIHAENSLILNKAAPFSAGQNINYFMELAGSSSC